MDDPKPRHEAYSYASAGDIEPAEEFPILYRLLTAEGKGTKRSSSSSFISSNPYFPISHRRSRKNGNGGDSANKDNQTSSTVEADSTSDISLTHILARSKFVSSHDLARPSRSGSGRNGNGNGGGSRAAKRKGKKNEKLKDAADDDEMLPSSTTKDDDDDDDDYFYNSNSSPPRKRPKFPQSLKRALSYKKEVDNKTEEDMEESQEPLLVSSLSVNERLAVLLGQQQVNNTNNNNSNDETEPPNLVPYNNLIVNTQRNENSRVHYHQNNHHEGGALRTLLSRPPRTTSSPPHNRRLIFPNATATATISTSPFPAAPTQAAAVTATKTPAAAKDERDGSRDDDDEHQKKILIKGVVEQLRAAASQRLNSFFSFKRSFTPSPTSDGRICNNPEESQPRQAAQLDYVCPHKCSHCDLTFSRLHHLSQHESTVHSPKPVRESEKFFCSLCSQEFQLSREGFQTHVEECFDRKYPPQSYSKKTGARRQKEEDGVRTLANAKYSAPPVRTLRPAAKQYVGLSELLEAKVEDSASSFHSFALPSK